MSVFKWKDLDKSISTLPHKPCPTILYTVFLLINAPAAMQNIGREPLFCTQFAKQKVYPILYFFVFWGFLG